MKLSILSDVTIVRNYLPDS